MDDIHARLKRTFIVTLTGFFIVILLLFIVRGARDEARLRAQHARHPRLSAG